MTNHKVGTREQWLTARRELLEREKELTRRSDELARERRGLPWVHVDDPYSFATSDGTKTLAELFAGRSQLLVYHLMFGPEDTVPCIGCSYTADNLDGGSTAHGSCSTARPRDAMPTSKAGRSAAPMRNLPLTWRPQGSGEDRVAGVLDPESGLDGAVTDERPGGKFERAADR